MTPNPRGRQTFNLDLAAQTDSPDHFLTAEEAAEFLGQINPRTLTRWAREGRIPAYPLGEGMRRLWRFRKADLHSWMQSRRSGPGLAPDFESGKLFAATDASEQRRPQ